jgi:hypothetical protein
MVNKGKPGRVQEAIASASGPQETEGYDPLGEGILLHQGVLLPLELQK